MHSTQTLTPDPAVPPQDAVWVPGFGWKGEGKGANYGVGIPPPEVVPPSDLPAALQQPGTSSGHPGGEDPSSQPMIPLPFTATSEQVEEWVSSLYRPLSNLTRNNPPEPGESVLWRGVKLGKHGGSSTKVEYFNATEVLPTAKMQQKK